MPFFVLISRAINFNSKWPKIVRNPAPCQTEITKAKVEKKSSAWAHLVYTSSSSQCRSSFSIIFYFIIMVFLESVYQQPQTSLD